MKTKNTKIDRMILYFFNNNINIIYFIIISLLALFIRNEFRGWVTQDYQKFLLPWSEYLESNGGFAGIASGPPNANYPVAYLYILAFLTYLPASYLAKIKVVSVFFDFVSAVFVMLTVRELGGYRKRSIIPLLAYATALLIPTSILNSAAWGQCDSIYTCFLLITLYFLIKEKYPLALIGFGIAFSFKLQAIFFLPVLLLLYFKNKNFSLLHFLFIPVTFFLISLPAIIIGKPIDEILNIYINQMQTHQMTVLNFPNMYNFLPDLYRQFAVPGILLTLAILISLYSVILKSTHIILQDSSLIEVSLLTVMICVYTLPSMHERYLFSGDMIAVIYTFIRKDRPYVPLSIWFISLNGYILYLFKFGPLIDYRILAIVYFAIIVVMARDLIYNVHRNILPRKTKISNMYLFR